MADEFHSVLFVTSVILSSAFIVKMWRTKVVEMAAEMAATPILWAGIAIKYFVYFGAVTAGISGVFGLGMAAFIYLGGSVSLPQSVNFTASPSIGGSVNWTVVPDDVSRWRDHITNAANECDVDVVLLTAMIQQESGGNPAVCSGAGACGLIQLMPDTAREMGVIDVFNPEDNLRGGACYLKKQLTRYDNNVELSLAAYNAGAGSVDKYGGVPPFKETQLYIRNITSLIERYEGTTTPLVLATSLPYEINQKCCRWPTDKGVISQGVRKGHVALDIAMPIGTPLYASHDGEVIVSGVHDGNYGGYGEYVMIDGGEFKTLYGHLDVRGVTVGEKVKSGQFIGYSGTTGNSTGPHLHFEVYYNGQIIDPTNFLPAKTIN